LNYSEFCQPFYTSNKNTSGIKGKVGQSAIAVYFAELVLGDRAKMELTFSEDLFRKWFKGEREPSSDLWKVMNQCFDEVAVTKALSRDLNDKVLPDLIKKFGIKLDDDTPGDKHAFASALSKQIKLIVGGAGEADSIVDKEYQAYIDVDEFPNYVRKSQEKYSKMKTLLYSSEERPFNEFFVCNTISAQYVGYPLRHNQIPGNLKIENVTLDKLAEKSKFVLLVGMGGIGKSMMMRHLFLSSIKDYPQNGLIPILVTLREFGSENKDLFAIIADSVHRFDITFSMAHLDRMMAAGKCRLLLDGLDEIKSVDMKDFQLQLDSLIDRYPNNQYVMSTRRFSNFVELSRFMIFGMMPFSNEQALQLIDKLEYCPEEPRFKQKFREKLVKEYFRTHSEFVRNPLLLTLMLMNYRRFADVPEKKYVFYEQAYQTLLQRHDSDKLAYKRAFQSVTDPSDFTLVFRELCAKSYRKGDYEFDTNKFDDYFEKLHAVKRLNSPLMKRDNFLFDMCHSACLMYEEGQSYHFLHRSFQEYFFADYYSRQDDTTLRKLGKSIEESDRVLYDDLYALDMLYDLAPDKVERFIIIPFLETIFRQGDESNDYWRFLSVGYCSWGYTMLNDENVDKYEKEYKLRGQLPYFRANNEPSSQLMSLTLRILHIPVNFQLPAKEVGTEFKFPDLLCDVLYAEKCVDANNDTIIVPMVHVPRHYFKNKKFMDDPEIKDRILMDEENNPVEFAYIYSFDFKLALSRPDKYPAIIDLWSKDSCPARNIYFKVKEYYENLVIKYAAADDEDDDDF
jgi:hypothetical protein